MSDVYADIQHARDVLAANPGYQDRDRRLPIVQRRIVSPPSIPIPAAMTEQIAAHIYGQYIARERALQLVADMAAEQGPVTEAELEALREEWPVS